MVNNNKAIATIPLIKFSCNGGIRSPKRPYNTEAIAHKQAADKAAISPFHANFEKILKIILTPLQILNNFHIFMINTLIKVSTLWSLLLIFRG